MFVSRLVQSFWFLRFLWLLVSWWVWWLYYLHYQLIYTRLFGIRKLVSLQRFYFKRFLKTSIITMTVWKTIYNFHQFWFRCSLFILFNSVCKHRSNSLRRFGLLEGAQEMLFVPFPQESLLRDAGHSLNFSVLLVEMNSPLQNIKKLSTLVNYFAIEAVLEKVYTVSPRVGSWNRMHPISVVTL